MMLEPLYVELKDSLMHVLLLDYWRKHHKVINLSSLQLPVVLKRQAGLEEMLLRSQVLA